MIALEAAEGRVGDAVVYRPPGQPVEQGVVVGANEQYVFVRYGSDLTAKATRPEDLEWLA